jgi:hypothetical protein
MSNKQKKQSKKQGKKKSPKQKQPKRSSAAMPMKGNMAMARGACSITNPFCPEAIGSRWPDNSYTKSVGWSITNRSGSLGSNASGSGSTLLTCDVGGYSLTSSSVVGDVVTYPATFTPVTTFPSNAARYRITSWGIKINTLLSKMTAAGMIRIRLFSPIGGATLGVTSLSSPFADASLDLPVSRLVDKDMFIFAAPLGDNARIFRDAAAVTSTVANWINPGFQVIQIGFDGAPVSTGILNMSVFINYEIVFADGDSSNAYAQPPPANNLPLQQLSAYVQARTGNFIQGSGEMIDKVVMKVAEVGMKAAIGGAMGYFRGGPPGAALGAITNGSMAMIVD